MRRFIGLAFSKLALLSLKRFYGFSSLFFANLYFFWMQLNHNFIAKGLRMYEEIDERSSAKKKKRSRGTRGGGSRRRKDRNEPKYEQQNGQHFQHRQQNLRINGHHANVSGINSYDQYPPSLVMSSSSLSAGSSSSGSFSKETHDEHRKPADAFNSLMEFPCLPPLSNRNRNNPINQVKKQNSSAMAILPSKDMMLDNQESKSLQLDNPIDDVVARCPIPLYYCATQQQQEKEKQAQHLPEECRKGSNFNFTNIRERIIKQRQMLPRGGSLFEISPRSFLMGRKERK